MWVSEECEGTMKRSLKRWFIALAIVIGVCIVAPTIWSYDTNYCSEGILHPVWETQKGPHYPDASAREGEEGTTLLRVVVGKEGAPTTVSTASSSGFPRLDAASVQYVKDWRWEPLAWGCFSITTSVKIAWKLNDVLPWIPRHR